MSKKKWVYLVIAAIFVLGLLAGGCAKAPQTTTPTTASPTTPSATKPTTTAPTPAQPQVIKWRLQGLTAAGSETHKYILLFADRVKEATGGRIEIECYPSGGLVEASQAFDPLAAGAFELDHYASTYAGGKLGPIANMDFGCAALLPHNWQYVNFFYNEGFLDTMREAYAEHNIYYVSPCWFSGYDLISKEPVRGLDDLKGLKCRAMGGMGKIFEKAGASPVMIPAPEIYTALQTGLVDAVLYGAADLYKALGLQEVTDYIVVPMMTYNQCPLLANMDAWNKLPNDLQQIVEYVAYKTLIWDHPMHTIMLSEEILNEWEKTGEVQRVYWSDDDIAQFRDLMWQFTQEDVQANPLPSATKGLEQVRAYLEKLGLI